MDHPAQLRVSAMGASRTGLRQSVGRIGTIKVKPGEQFHQGSSVHALVPGCRRMRNIVRRASLRRCELGVAVNAVHVLARTYMEGGLSMSEPRRPKPLWTDVFQAFGLTLG